MSGSVTTPLSAVAVAMDRETRPAAPALELPLDRARRPGTAGTRVVFVPEHSVQAPVSYVFAAFAALLARYSGQDEFAIGVCARELTGDRLVPLSLRLDGEPTFREVAERERDGEAEGASCQALFSETETAEAPAEVELWLIAGERARVLYNGDVFDAATIERMMRHFANLLESALANPDLRISEAPMMSAAERRQVLVEWNDTAREFPRECVQRLFEQQVERNARAIACVERDGTTITYAELNARANRLAHYLRQRGAARETPVAVCLERSSGLIVALLAILKTGAAYVPLDPGYPAERLGYILEDSRAALAVTEEHLRERLRAFSGTAVLVNVEAAAIAQQPEQNLDAPTGADQLAYIMFTSGSTGRPKGVAIEHRSVAAFVDWARGVFSSAELAGVLFSTSVCFDLSVFEIFVTLSCGGALVIAENALELGSLRARDRVTLINTVPSAIAELVRERQVPSSVKTVNLGGEAVPQEIVEPIFAGTSAERLYDLYGPTEDTVYSTYSDIRPGDRVTIGRPMTNRRAYILDRQMRPVPVGVTGELYLAGEGLARGYFGRPDLTAERFVSGAEAGEERMYRTGDLCRRLPDGQIFYLGRADHQVKVRGFRIELGEIEAALGRHPGVRGCVVAAREDSRGEKQLVAYIATDQGAGPESGELRDWAGRFVPKYMVPSVFVRLPQLPRTLNGKIDRKSLPAPAATDYVHSGEYMAPRTALEHRLAAIWEEVLGIKPVGIRNSFFDIGGQSLLAVRLFTTISRTFGKDLPLSTLFECPTIEQLARRIEERSAVTYSRLTPIQPNGSKPPFFCVHGGRGGTLFLHRVANLVDPDRPFFGIEPEGLDGREMRHKTIESLAASYVAEIRKVQPRGPYYLGGYCVGGIVAFEMAQQLVRNGEETAALVLLTAPLRFGGRRNAEAPKESRKQPEQTPVGVIGWIREGIGWRARLWRARSEKLRLQLFFSLGRRIPRSERGEYVARNLYEAEKRYRPEPYPGTLSLIRGSRMTEFGPDFGWDGLAGRVEHRVVGESQFEDRRELFQDPLAEITARELREYLESSARNENGGSCQNAAD